MRGMTTRQEVTVRYTLCQDTPDGRWLSSEVFEGEMYQVRQAVVAGFLGGQPRWAEDESGRFLYGLDQHGREMKAAPERPRR